MYFIFINKIVPVTYTHTVGASNGEIQTSNQKLDNNFEFYITINTIEVRNPDYISTMQYAFVLSSNSIFFLKKRF